MCEKLIRKNKKIKVQYLEVKIKSSATIDLIKYLKKKHSNTEFFLIIGSDNLISLNKWKNWKQLVKLTKIVVFSRKDYDQKVKKSGIFRKMKKIIFIKNKYINISSTQLRNKLN